MLASQLPIYVHPEVASLAWAIGSAPMLANNFDSLNLYTEEECDFLFESHRDWLHQWDKQPKLLLEWLERNENKMLGHRFESLLAFFFTHSPFFELLYRNVVLMHEKNTRGEFDFIVKDLTANRTVHVEVACKYYIGISAGNAARHWIGPNGHDSLLLKLEKLKQQVKLFSTESGEEFLASRNVRIQESKVFLKGYFFHHLKDFPTARPPKGANQHYNAGWYVFDEELMQLADDVQQWLILPKKFWMSPIHFSNALFQKMSGIEMRDAVLKEMKRTQKAQMIIQVRETAGMLNEVSRGFVVIRNRIPVG